MSSERKDDELREHMLEACNEAAAVREGEELVGYVIVGLFGNRVNQYVRLSSAAHCEECNETITAIRNAITAEAANLAKRGLS